MVINLRKLLRLPVYTESGAKLGRVFDCEIDTENHQVVHYMVKANALSVVIFLIQSTQIISISSEKIIVEDAVITREAQAAYGSPAVEE